MLVAVKLMKPEKTVFIKVNQITPNLSHKKVNLLANVSCYTPLLELFKLISAMYIIDEMIGRQKIERSHF